MDKVHRRYNPLLDEWILVSPHRMSRPWKGQLEKEAKYNIEDQSNNPLKPGGLRPGGNSNPFYDDIFVFGNDFPALVSEEANFSDLNKDDLLRWEPISGRCDVMCFHGDSHMTLALMNIDEIQKVIKKWMQLIKEYGETYSWVQIFENRGDIMGCSNPHPHCQIWSSKFLPTNPLKKNLNQKNYYISKKSPLLIDYLKVELNKKDRIVLENDSWVCLVAFWAVWPYETYLIPKRHILRLQDLKESEISDLAEIMKMLLTKYDNLFETRFPYSMGWHGAPTGEYLNEDMNHWQLHAIYLPPLLRSATIKKFMVGYEMMAEPQRDLTAEKAANILRQLSTIHHEESDNNN